VAASPSWLHRGVIHFAPNLIEYTKLNRLVVEKGGPLPRSGISEWLTEFGLSGADIFDRLNEAHTRVYSVVGIVGE